jgi:transposase
MGQVTVFSGPERRRRWSEDERLQILAEAFSPGARVAEVCRRHDLSSGLIYTWRRKLREAGTQTLPDAVPEPVFAEAVMDEDTGVVSPGQHPSIIVDLARGKRLNIFAAGSPSQIAAALKALR